MLPLAESWGAGRTDTTHNRCPGHVGRPIEQPPGSARRRQTVAGPVYGYHADTEPSVLLVQRDRIKPRSRHPVQIHHRLAGDVTVLAVAEDSPVVEADSTLTPPVT
jgi:hypothetical protein